MAIRGSQENLATFRWMLMASCAIAGRLAAWKPLLQVRRSLNAPKRKLPKVKIPLSVNWPIITQEGEINQRTIIEAAHLGDQFAIELLEEAGEVLAKGISILIHLFNPEAIIIGGQMAEAENLIKDPIYPEVKQIHHATLEAGYPDFS
jgi:hypothetical protein